jgi:mono/diheme cytochrome c family protein
MTLTAKALFAAPLTTFAFGLAALSDPSAADTDAVADPVPAAVMEQGEALYLKNCRLCHGSKGTSGKPLAANEMLENADYVASVILWGPGYMASFADHLTDDEIALIVTYVRNSWGHAYGATAASDVTPLR